MIKFVAFLVSIVGILSCKTQSGTNVAPQDTFNIQIIPDFNGEPLVMYKTYSLNGKPIQFTRFSFILSRLCDSKSKDNESRQTQFDFSVNTEEASALKGITNTIRPYQDNIKNLRLGFGVDSVDNSNPPSLQIATSPLFNGLNYWDAWNSFIFMKIEGKYDRDGDGIFETPFALHSGGNSSYSEKNYLLDYQNLPLSPNFLRVQFDINLAKILNGIDLNVTTQTQKTADLPLMVLMISNLKNALIYKGTFPN